MGHAYLYRCKHCGFEEKFYQGHGFLVHSQPLTEYLEQRTQLFHYKTHSLLKQLNRQQPNLYLKAGFQVYICPKCRILRDKVEVVVFNEKEEVHRSEFRCHECRTRMKLTNIHRLKKATCPKCHHIEFQLNHAHRHLWD